MITNKHLMSTLGYGVGAKHLPEMKLKTLEDSMDFKMTEIGSRTAVMFSPCSIYGIIADLKSRVEKPFHDHDWRPTNGYFMRGKHIDCGGAAGTFAFHRTIHSVVDLGW